MGRKAGGSNAAAGGKKRKPRRTLVPPPATRNALEPVCLALPAVLEERLRRSGLSIVEIARRAHVSRETIRLLQRGKRLPSFPVAACLCRVVGCTLAELIEDAEERCRRRR